jgi:hypothetical protein
MKFIQRNSVESGRRTNKDSIERVVFILLIFQREIDKTLK